MSKKVSDSTLSQRISIPRGAREVEAYNPNFQQSLENFQAQNFKLFITPASAQSVLGIRNLSSLLVITYL